MKMCNICKIEKEYDCFHKKSTSKDGYRSQCKECGGGSICEHNRKRSVCKDCDGGSICEHKHQKAHCNYCSGKWKRGN